MIRHVVLFKFSPGTPAATLEEIRDGLAALERKIGGFAAYRWGAGVTDDGRQHGYTHGFTMDFADEASLRRYGPHAEHQKVVAIIKPHLVADDDAVLAFDYAC
ncbi:MAG: hypothetical protein BIFFINMI_03236 [Phycisphaerae bacterium]|nr:hypothetical protein [Phycisphaerae bacterium]